MKAFARIAAILSLCFALSCLSGCMPQSTYSKSLVDEIDFPESAEPVPEVVIGDTRAEYDYSAMLFYVSLDYKRLVPIPYEMRVLSDDVLPAKVIERLLLPANSPNVRSVAPEETTLLSYEQSEGIATVTLSSDAHALSEQDLMWMYVAITNTLTEFPDITGVNIIIGGQSDGVFELPVGTLSRTWENLSTIYMQNMIEKTQFLQSEPSEPLSRKVTLYFASADDRSRVVPELRSMEFQSTNLVDELLDELLKGPDEAPYKSRVLPSTALEGALRTRSSHIITTDEGRRIIRLYLNPVIQDAMRKEGLSEWQLYASLTLSLCRTVPEVDGITINIGDMRVSQVDNGTEVISFQDGYMTPADFSSIIGSVIKLYFAGGDSYLTGVSRVVDLKYAFYPRAWLNELIAGPTSSDGVVSSVIPTGITADDVLGTRLENETMHINLSSNFYRCCQNLSPQEERNLIYAIVNTMTGLHDIKRVRLLFEGEAFDSLTGPTAISGSLIRNPGIVK